MRKMCLMENKLLKILAINNAVKSLNLQCDPEHLTYVSGEIDPIEIA